jgi:hypothetical protein
LLVQAERGRKGQHEHARVDVALSGAAAVEGCDREEAGCTKHARGMCQPETGGTAAAAQRPHLDVCWCVQVCCLERLQQPAVQLEVVKAGGWLVVCRLAVLPADLQPSEACHHRPLLLLHQTLLLRLAQQAPAAAVACAD